MAGMNYRLRQATNVLWQGGIIAYPTEGIWGLGCLPLELDAIHRILTIKQRAPDKGLILVAANFDQLEPYLAPLPLANRKAMLDTWPGPVTWVAPAARWVPMDITGGRSTVALRVSAHAGVQALCRAADSALVSTSANRSGRSPARSLLETRLRFGMEVDNIVPGKVGTLTGPTEIRDALSGKILRPAARGTSA
ncbi:MAG: Sua5/YciO/YrdC/YwlC family protein [Gammaproteobacteria bacterium]|nr:Sua5/YciO/YrdC/YwlC family protein [Gammaproteobacteria bacterium]